MPNGGTKRGVSLCQQNSMKGLLNAIEAPLTCNKMEGPEDDLIGRFRKMIGTGNTKRYRSKQGMSRICRCKKRREKEYDIKKRKQAH